LRIAALVKQVPMFEAMQLGENGRLVREGLELELNPYCRRAVSKGVELARETGGTCTVVTLGPPAAEDVLRESIAWGADRGVLVTDPQFAGSDTLATARALAAVIEREGPFDLVLVGRNSVDADTGQVGPEVAELLDLPFATGVKQLDLGDGQLKVLCEEDDGQTERIVQLPAVISTAERLTEPAKVKPEGRAAVDASLITTLAAADLGAGPWGQDGSGTYVGEVRVLEIERAHLMLAGDVDAQVDQAVRLLAERGALDMRRTGLALEVTAARGVRGQAVVVAVEPDRANLTDELLAAAALLALDITGHVVAFAAPPEAQAGALAAAGADALVVFDGAEAEEDVAAALAAWAEREQPWAILLPSTAWGREVASRAAARLGAGLTGDAVGLEVSTAVTTREMQLLAWKPAFGGRLVAAIYASSPIQMATVRAGVLPRPAHRSTVPPLGTTYMNVEPRGRVRVTSRARDDDVDVLATAQRVVCVGAAVQPAEYEDVQPLLDVLHAELAATRKVTDKGWQPRARQIGITGRSVAPRLYIGIGLSGKFNHAVGVRAAGTVLAINPDPAAPIWDHVDIGIVAEWREVVPRLTARLQEQLS
jgi:electron transfer flavoprotein alpha subunit